MNAIISGSAGVAVVMDGGAMFSIDIDRLDALTPCQPRDIAYLFGDARDREVVERVDAATVKRLLDEAWRGAEALQLTLILLDGEMDDETRALAATELEEALGFDGTAKRLENVLWSTPSPASASIAAARALCAKVKATAARALLDRLVERQDVIEEVWDAFERLPVRRFGAREADRARARAALVREGVFRELVEARVSGRSAGAVAAASQMRAGVQVVKSHRDILQAWVMPLGEAHPERTERADNVHEAEPQQGAKSGKKGPFGGDRAKVPLYVQRNDDALHVHESLLSYGIVRNAEAQPSLDRDSTKQSESRRKKTQGR